MPTPHFISRALLATALTGAALALPARADDDPRAAEPRRPDGDRPRGERPGAGESRLEPAAMIERTKADILALDLSAEQTAKVEQIFAKAKDDLASDRKQAEGKDPAERVENVRAILRGMRENVGGVLTEEQRQSLRQRVERAGRGVREGGGMLAERIKNAMSSIELNDEQKKKLDALLAESQSKAQEINEQTRSKLRELMQDTRDRIDALLTPEQREKFKNALPEGGPPRGNPDGGERRRTEPPADRL